MGEREEEYIPDSETVAFHSMLLAGITCISLLFIIGGIVGKLLFLFSPIIAIVFGFIGYSYAEYENGRLLKTQEPKKSR